MGLLQGNGFVRARVPHFHALFKGTADNAHESQPIPVGRVHVRLNLEHKAGEVGLLGADHAGIALPGQGRRRVLQETIQEGLHTKVGHGRAEEHGRQFAPAYSLQIEGITGLIQQLDFLVQPIPIMLVQQGFQHGIIHGNVSFLHHLFAVVAAGVQLHHFRIPVVDALEIPIHADGPVNGTGADAQHLLQFFHQRKGILGGSVHFIHKGENRYVPHPADLEQLNGLGFHALGGVDQHNCRIGSHQHPVSILGEVLVSGGIQNVDAESVIFKLHGRRGDRNAALLFNVHPVGSGVFVALASLNTAGRPNGSAVKQELFGQGRFAGVRVRNNGKGSPLFHLLMQHVAESLCITCG